MIKKSESTTKKPQNKTEQKKLKNALHQMCWKSGLNSYEIKKFKHVLHIQIL